VKNNNKCILEFLWKTSIVCHRKLILFDILTCSATIKGHNNNFVHNKIIDMKNILNNNKVSSNSIIYIGMCINHLYI